MQKSIDISKKSIDFNVKKCIDMPLNNVNKMLKLKVFLFVLFYKS